MLLLPSEISSESEGSLLARNTKYKQQIQSLQEPSH